MKDKNQVIERSSLTIRIQTLLYEQAKQKYDSLTEEWEKAILHKAADPTTPKKGTTKGMSMNIFKQPKSAGQVRSWGTLLWDEIYWHREDRVLIHSFSFAMAYTVASTGGRSSVKGHDCSRAVQVPTGTHK